MFQPGDRVIGVVERGDAESGPLGLDSVPGTVDRVDGQRVFWTPDGYEEETWNNASILKMIEDEDTEDEDQDYRDEVMREYTWLISEGWGGSSDHPKDLRAAHLNEAVRNSIDIPALRKFLNANQ
jgi:hypothetical protein